MHKSPSSTEEEPPCSFWHTSFIVCLLVVNQQSRAQQMRVHRSVCVHSGTCSFASQDASERKDLLDVLCVLDVATVVRRGNVAVVLDQGQQISEAQLFNMTLGKCLARHLSLMMIIEAQLLGLIIDVGR
jgi:hypothetical protein